MGCFDFLKKEDPQVNQANLPCLTVNARKVEFVIPSTIPPPKKGVVVPRVDDNAKHCALNDLLPFLRDTFPSHRGVFVPSAKELKTVLTQARKGKRGRFYSYQHAGAAARARAEFLPLSVFLPLLNVALLSAAEVDSLHVLLVARLDTNPPPTAQVASTKSAQQDFEDKMAAAGVSQITTTMVAPFSPVCTPKAGPSQQKAPMLGDTVQLQSFNDDTSRSFSPAPGGSGNEKDSTKDGGETKEGSALAAAMATAAIAAAAKAAAKRERRREKKRKLKEAALRSLDQMEQNYQLISQKFENMIVENKSLLVSPRLPGAEEVAGTKSPGQQDVRPGSAVPGGDSISVREALLQQQAKHLAERRERMKGQKLDRFKLLRETSKLTYSMPRWRHVAAGVTDPQPEYVLGGKRLFRLVARLVLHFYAKPILKVRKRRLEDKGGLMEEFARSSQLFFDICSGWVGKVVQIPLMSILQVSRTSYL